MKVSFKMNVENKKDSNYWTNDFVLLEEYGERYTLVKSRGTTPYMNTLEKFNDNYDLLELYKVLKRVCKNEKPRFDYEDLDFIGYLQDSIFEIARDDLKLSLELSKYFFEDVYEHYEKQCKEVYYHG